MSYRWFQENRERLAQELIAVERLRASVQWLIETQWATDGTLFLDAVIRAHRHDYRVRMDYPTYFPAVPPTIRPTNAEFRWTGHQYGGIDGPLCLEWGADNWLESVTGAQMLESAYKLFHTENPLGLGRAEYANPAPSRHHLTPGQELRFQWGRYHLGEQLQTALKSLPDKTMGVIRCTQHSRECMWFVLAHGVESSDGKQIQRDDTIPQFMRGQNDKELQSAVFFKTTLAPEALNSVKLPFHLRTRLWQDGFDAGMLSKDVKPNSLGLPRRPFGVLILDNTSSAHFLLFIDNKLYKLGAVHKAINAGVQRMPEHLEGLSTKLVGIVGVGSAGSKLAASLARMGVTSFYLVDHDVFLPENVQRNELDWGDVGQHKVDAVRELLSRINAKVEVKTSRLHLTGQEATDAVAEAIERLSRCDIIIDATANPTVFNIIAAVATAAKRSMAWLEVYGGGIGGLIARSRPGRDPEARLIRKAYNLYCEEHPMPDGVQLGEYAVADAEGRVQTASDADVGIIAANAARLAVDTVLDRDPSAYRFSLYLIGLEQSWVFTQAMHTIPLQTDNMVQEEAVPDPAPIENEKIQRLISDLLENAHADSAPS